MTVVGLPAQPMNSKDSRGISEYMNTLNLQPSGFNLGISIRPGINLVKVFLKRLNSLILLDDFFPHLTKGTADQSKHTSHHNIWTCFRSHTHGQEEKC